MRRGLRALEEERLLTFLDASKAFNAEPFTTFADSWHFADAGHRILAERMIVAISAGSERKPGSEASGAAVAPSARSIRPRDPVAQSVLGGVPRRRPEDRRAGLSQPDLVRRS